MEISVASVAEKNQGRETHMITMFVERPARNVGLFFLLFSALLLLLVLLGEGTKGERTWVVDDDEGDFETIQDAVNASEDGDTIRVWEGVYEENVVVDKTLSLVGNGSVNTTIDGGGVGDVMRITADWCNVSGFQMTGSEDQSPHAGINVESAYNHIFENNCSYNYYGIYLYRWSEHNTLANNTCSSNSREGISLYSSEGNTLENNICSNNHDSIYLSVSDDNTLTNNTCSSNTWEGIYLSNSNNNTFTSNTCSDNKYGIYLDGSCDNILSNNTFLDDDIFLRDSQRNILQGNLMRSGGVSIWGDGLDDWNSHTINISNTVNGKPIYYYTNSHNASVPDGSGQLILANCENMTLENQSYENTSIGIQLGYCRYIFVSNTSCSSNKRGGIRVYTSEHITISNCTWSDNAGKGIFLSDSDDNILSNNTSVNNTRDGIFLSDSDRNTIIHNTCSNNSYSGVSVHRRRDNNILSNTICSNTGYGIDLYASDFNTILNNTISANGIGICLRRSSFENAAHHNIISSNTLHGIDAEDNEDDSINATDNWWGDPSGPYHPATNPSGKGDNVTVYVVFDPWLEKLVRNTGKGTSYYTIQEAIDDADEGNTIRVYEGTYEENIIINKTITLIGSGSANTIIDGGGVGDVVRLTADWCNVSGFKVTGSGNDSYDAGIAVESDHNHIFENNCSNNYYGIYLDTSDNNTVENNTCENNDDGIYLFNASHNTIVSNTCPSNDCGIRLDMADNNTIENNTCDLNRALGIWLRSSSDCTITNNNCSSNNYYGIFIDSTSNSNTIANNTCSENNEGGIYLSESDNNTIRSNTCENNDRGIFLSSSDDNTIKNNSGSNNNYGIYLSLSDNNTITNNTCGSNDKQGIYLGESDNNTLTNNSCSSNMREGIYLDRSDNNTLTNNTCLLNQYHGIYLWSCLYVTLTDNTCVNNTRCGLFLWHSDNNTLANTTCSSNAWYGIYLDESDNNIFTNNSCSSNTKEGIYLRFSSCNVFYYNWMVDDGICFWGNSLEYWNTHKIDSTNIVNGKPVRYYKNASSMTISPGAGQVILANCSWFTIENQDLSNGSVGVLVGYSSNITITNNSCSTNSREGIFLYESGNNTLSNNSCLSNDDEAIYLYRSSNNTITSNTCSSNEDGIHLRESDNNILTNNTLSNNSYGILLNSHSQENSAHNNTITGNAKYGIHALSNNGLTINATNNWWGSVFGPYHPAKNPSGNGDEISDYVLFDPWLGKGEIPENALYVWAQAPPGGNGSWKKPFNYIQDAITVAEEGATIYVWEGNYSEWVLVDKTVSLVGNGSASTVVSFGGSTDVVRIIEADWVNISGFELMGGGDTYASLRVERGDHTHIFENRFSSNHYGIYLFDADDSLIENNNCSGTLDYGMYIYNLANTTIIGNNCSSNNKYGIFLSATENNNLSSNTYSWNGWYGIYLSSTANYNILTDNTCVSNAVNGIFLVSNINNTLMDNLCSLNSGAGISLLSSKNNILTSNNCSSNWNCGIEISGYETHNILENNSCHSNQYCGIYLSTSYNTLTNNSCDDNTLAGIILYSSGYSSGHNTLKGNTMVGNGLAIGGGELEDWNSLVMEDNTVNGKPLYYYTNQTGGDVPPGAGQIVLVNCTNVKIEDQDLSHGSVGILIGFSSYIDISRVSSSFNKAYGIWITESSYCNVSRSTVSSNMVNGIFLSESDNINLHNNTLFFNKGKGIYLSYSDRATITNSSIVGNGVGVHLDNSYQGVVVYNTIFNNTDYGIIFTGSPEDFVLATDNYWGDRSGPYHQANNTGGKGDNVTDYVDFDPWKKEPAIIFAHIDDISPNPATDTGMTHFKGYGTGREGIARYSWRSDIDGELYNGTEAEFSVSGLSLGVHIIYLKLQDHAGFWSDEVSRSLLIHTRPTAFIDSISPSPTLETDTILLAGWGEDDGTIERYVWLVNGNEEHNSTIPTCHITMPAGTHTIALRVQDNHGAWSEEVGTTLSVYENDWPEAHIISVKPNPAHEDDDIRLAGNGTDDGEVAGWCWRSDIDGILTIKEKTRNRELYLTADHRLLGVPGDENERTTIRAAYSQFGEDIRTDRRWAEAGSWELDAGGDITFRGNITVTILYREINEAYDNEPKFRFTLLKGKEVLGGVAGEIDSGSSTTLRTYTVSFALGETNLSGSDTLKLRIDYLGWENCQLVFGNGNQESRIRFEEWQWTMNAGQNENATVSGLSPGNHTIFFSVQDNNGAWSQEEETTLQVKVAEPQEWYEKPAVLGACGLVLVVVAVMALVVVKGLLPLNREELLRWFKGETDGAKKGSDDEGNWRKQQP